MQATSNAMPRIQNAGQHFQAAYHLYSQIPEKIVVSIVCLAKLIFNAALAGLTFGQVKAFNGEVVLNSFKLLNNVGRTLILSYAIVDPIKTAEAQAKFSFWCFENFAKWTQSSRDVLVLVTTETAITV